MILVILSPEKTCKVLVIPTVLWMFIEAHSITVDVECEIVE